MPSFRIVKYQVLLIALVTFALSRGAIAADATIVGVLAVAIDADVAKELGLTDETLQKLVKLVDQREGAALELAYSMKKDAPAAEKDAKLREFREESEQLGLKLLSDAQRQRLEQIHLERGGLASLADSRIAEKLKLSVDQTGAIADLIKQRDDALSKTSGNEGRAVRADFERKLGDVLTAQQRTAWDQLTGAPVGAGETVAASAPEKSAEKPAVSGASGSTPAAETTPKTAENPPADRGNSRPSFPSRGNSRSSDNTQRGDRADGSATKAKAPGSPADEYRFNFHHMPWKDVLEWLAEQADLSLVMDAPPPGTFNYYDARAYKLPEVIDIINGVLLPKGYTLVRKDRMMTLVNFQGGQIPPTMIPSITLDELKDRGRNEIVSTVFAVRALTPDEAERVMDRMVDRVYGKILVLPQARQIEVTETAGRLRTIQQILDHAEGPAGLGRDDLRPFELKHATPYEVLATIKQLMGIAIDRNSTEDGSLRVIIDAAGRRLLATGKPDKLQRVTEIVKMLDVPGRGNDALVFEQPQFETYAISSADSATALKVLQTLMAGLPDVRLDIDPKTGNIYAYARPSQHKTIQATLDQLQRDGKRLEVIQLRNVDAATAQTAVTKLFQMEGENSSIAPKVEADSSLHQLLVRGTEGQIAQIRALVDKMEGRDTTVADGDRGKMRMIPLTGRQAQTAIEAMQQIWGAKHRNQIRVVTPSSAIQEVKPVGEPPQAAAPSDQAGVIKTETAPASAARALPPHPNAEPNYDPPIRGARPVETLPPDATTTKIIKPKEIAPQPKSDQKPAEKKDRTTFIFPAAYPAARVFLASQPVEVAENGAVENAPIADSLAADQKEPAKTDATEKDSNTKQDESIPGAPIVIVPGPGGLLITSDDKEALDEFEKMLTALASREISGGPKYTVFYCKYAKAQVVAETILKIHAGGGASSGGGDFVGDFAENMFGGFAGGLIGNMFGGGGGDSGEVTSGRGKYGPVEIIPDTRLNALFVSASPADLEMIEQLWKILDQQNSPEEIAVTPSPRLIPVRYTSAQSIAEVVQQVYSDRLTSSAGQRQVSPQEFLQALSGGRRRGGRGGGQQQEQEAAPKMSIGVDERNNAIVVAATDPLFNEVRLLVAQLDQPSDASRETTRVVTLKRTNPDSVKSALVSLLGDMAQTSTSGSTSSSNSQNRTNNQQRGQRGGQGGNQQFPMFTPGGGGFPGGGFPGGGFGGGGFGRGGGGFGGGGGFPGGGFGGGGGGFGGGRGGRGGGGGGRGGR
jgi:hypothetical protein